MTDEGGQVEPDTAGLAAEFPEWDIGAKWSAASSGPDGRSLVACRDGVTLTALTAAGLRRRLLEEGG